MGTVFNGLSHLSAVRERGQFIVGLLRGLGGNLNLKTRQEFAREVSSSFFFCFEKSGQVTMQLFYYFIHFLFQNGKDRLQHTINLVSADACLKMPSINSKQ